MKERHTRAIPSEPCAVNGDVLVARLFKGPVPMNPEEDRVNIETLSALAACCYRILSL